MILYDCHVHSNFSDDSDTAPELQIEAVLKKGFEGICFTDHLDYHYPSYDDAGIKFIFDVDTYWQKMSELKELYKGKIEVLIGFEAGLRNEPDQIAFMKNSYGKLLEKYPFDFVIGSTHCLEYTDPYYSDYWCDKSTEDGLRRYFEACRFNARNYDCYDTSGHFDYLVRYVPLCDDWHGVVDYNPLEFMDITDDFLNTLISKGKALECNTAGIKYGLGFAHPHDLVLKRYLELGGELLTIGSDGHKPEHTAYDFEDTCEHLKALGYKYYTVYKNRKPCFYRL